MGGRSSRMEESFDGTNGVPFVGRCAFFDSQDFCWVYLGDEIVSSYIGIILSQYHIP